MDWPVCLRPLLVAGARCRSSARGCCCCSSVGTPRNRHGVARGRTLDRPGGPLSTTQPLWRVVIGSSRVCLYGLRELSAALEHAGATTKDLYPPSPIRLKVRHNHCRDTPRTGTVRPRSIEENCFRRFAGCQASNDSSRNNSLSFMPRPVLDQWSYSCER